jgi:hypothetical protein
MKMTKKFILSMALGCLVWTSSAIGQDGGFNSEVQHP